MYESAYKLPKEAKRVFFTHITRPISTHLAITPGGNAGKAPDPQSQAPKQGGTQGGPGSHLG